MIKPLQACVGTSAGNSYLLYFHNNEFKMVDMNQKPYYGLSLLRYYFAGFVKSLNNHSTTSPIIDIAAQSDNLYITNKTTITKWKFNDEILTV